MQVRYSLFAGVAAVIGLAFAASPTLTVAQQWTLATDDTSLTIGFPAGLPAIFALKNPTQQFNWTQQPSPIPLLSSVSAQRPERGNELAVSGRDGRYHRSEPK